MKSFLSHPIIQWIWINIFQQNWVMFDKKAMWMETSKKFRTEGDQSKVQTTLLTNRKKWDKIAICKCLGAPSHLFCDDQFGNRLACLGVQLGHNETFAFRVGKEPANFFLGAIKKLDTAPLEIYFVEYCTKAQLETKYPRVRLL